MIEIRFTLDSKRRGESVVVKNLTAARREIRCDRPEFTKVDYYGYRRAWSVTCGDTVVADAFDVPHEGYFPRFDLTRKKPKKRRRR